MKARRTRVATYALILDGRRILLCRLGPLMDSLWVGYWTLPGGGIEFGEAPEAAMIREVEEETGLHVRATSIADVDSLHDDTGPDDYHGIRIIYHVEIVGGTLCHEAAGSTDRCEWHDLDEPLTIQLGDLADVGLRLARKALR